jgi:peptide/nickel transport system substrate-binding protein
MHNFLTFIKEFRIPRKEDLGDAFASFSRKQFVILGVSVVVAFIAMVILLQKINTSFMVDIPADGGTIIEGIIGAPTLINPVLSLSDADKDLTSLVYSGLTRKLADGTFVPDLAESFEVSPSGTTYTFHLKKGLTFHDGTPITADDVIFTIEKIKDPLVKSPRKIGWDGVTATKTDDMTVIFTLAKPYISFMDNTTIGILPSHLWKNVSPQEFGLSGLNIQAVGSGPYHITTVTKGDDGVPESYDLKRFQGFALGIPHIKNFNIVSFANEKDLLKALITHSIDQASGLSPENAESIKSADYTIHTATLPRIFGVFFNSSQNRIFTDPSVVQAFDKALNRQEIVDEVLNGYGTAIHSPVPETIVKGQQKFHDNSLEEAQAILDKAGWKVGDDGIRAKGGTRTVTTTKKVGKKTVTSTSQVSGGPVTRLSFTLTTGGTPELDHTANLIAQQLKAVGAEVQIQKIGETGQLNNLIRSREYEALFFGQIVNHESDLYSFWHSSQKQDPGLNIALYGNKNADLILENAQKSLDSATRINRYKDFIAEFNKNVPALLIYSPKYLYATSKDLNNVSLDTLTIPSDRFVSIHTWYARVDHVWKFFTK